MKRQIQTATVILTAGLFTLGFLVGCGKSRQNEAAIGQQSEKTTSISDTTGRSAESNTKKPLTMEEKDRVLSLDELKKYSDKKYIFCNLFDYREREISIDGYGNVIGGRNVGNLDIKVIEDVCSREVKYYKESYITVEGSDINENSVPHSRLYDAGGKMIYDWQEVDYGDACGDWIMMSNNPIDISLENSEDAAKTFINVKTGEVMDGVFDLASFDSKRAQLFNEVYGTVAIIDQEGKLCCENILEKAKGETVNIYQKNNYYYTVKEKETKEDEYIYTYSFYDADGKETFSVEDTNMIDFYKQNSVGPYIIADVKGKSQVWDLRGDGNGGCKVLYEASIITYYDGERMVGDLNRDNKYGIYDTDGKLFAEFEGKIFPENIAFDKICTDLGNHLKKAATFLVIDGDVIKRVDRYGRVLASVQIETAGFDIVEIENYDEGIYYYTDDFAHMGLLTNDLEEAVPFCEFTSVEIITDEMTGIQYFDVSLDDMWENLYTMDGEIVLENIGGIANIRDGKACIYKGKYFGIMDLNGQWIEKHSFLDYLEQWM